MITSRRHTLYLILVLATLSLACNAIAGLLGEDDTPETIVVDIPAAEGGEPVEAPEDATSSEEQPAGDEEAAVGSDDESDSTVTGDTEESQTLDLNPENAYNEPPVDFYKTSLEFSSTQVQADGSVTTGEITANAERIVEPHAMRLDFSAPNTVNNAPNTANIGGESFKIIQILVTQYFVLPTGECVSLPINEQENPFTILLSSGGVLGELEGASLVGTMESINGVDAHRYEFDESNLDPTDSVTENIDTLEGNIWIAWDGGYVVRITMEGRGVSELLNGNTQESDIYYELNYYDFDVPVEVVIPPECATASDTDYPILDDAKNISSMPGIFTYTTGYPFATAVDFYQTEMGNMGCNAGQELIADPTATLFYTCQIDDVNIDVIITVVLDPNGNGLQVGILEQPSG